MISFAITCHNETDSLEKLIKQILKYKRDKDELVILDDYSDKPTMDILYKYCQYDNVEYHQHALNKDFAGQKNYLKSLCRGTHVVAADADEYAHESLMENVHYIIEQNPDVEIIWVPRINTVEGLGLSHVKRWGWNISKLESQIDEKVMDDQSDEYQLLKQYNLIIEEKNV